MLVYIMDPGFLNDVFLMMLSMIQSMEISGIYIYIYKRISNGYTVSFNMVIQKMIHNTVTVVQMAYSMLWYLI